MDLIQSILECIRGPSAEIYLEKSYGPIHSTGSAEDITDEGIQINEKWGPYAEDSVEKSYGTFATIDCADDFPKEVAQSIQPSEKFVPCAESDAQKPFGLFILKRSDRKIVDKVIQTIQTSNMLPVDLRPQTREIVGEQGGENVAKATLYKLQDIVQQGEKDVGLCLSDAINWSSWAVGEVFQFAKDNCTTSAVFDTLVALGTLVLLAPGLVEDLGFDASGSIDVEGSPAAEWQSLYSEYITEESLDSFFQELEMTWEEMESTSVNDWSAW